MKKVAAYWWKTEPNWGDRLNWTLLNFLDVIPAWRDPENADFVMVGSVLEHLPEEWSGTVAGAGKLHEDAVVDLSHATVLALRGHLTRASVTGLPADQSVVLGDPALLVPRYIRQWHARYDLGVLPHWSDTELRQRFPHGHFIDPTGRPEDVVLQIAKCKRIITSSLHGVIVADAYGIPRRTELFPNAESEAEGGDFKFRDYASLYGEHPHFGEFWLAPHEIVERIQNDLEEVLQVGLGHKKRHALTSRPARVPIPPDEEWRSDRECPQISLLVPFRDDGEHRSRTWQWLRQYWFSQLGSVEIIQGRDYSYPFNKASAVNDAAARSRGRVLIILDADAYLDARVVQECADKIDAAVAAGKRRWFMPYTELYRLSRDVTEDILRTDPRNPYWVPSPPPVEWLEEDSQTSQSYGHEFGAMIQIMPKEAFFLVGGEDPRYNGGWGSEDSSMLRALDTLYCQHENTQNDLLHLWHLRPGHGWTDRRWIGQRWSPSNLRLTQRYANATGEPGFMRQLVDEHVQPVEPTDCVPPRPPWWCKLPRWYRFFLGLAGCGDEGRHQR